MAIHTFITHIGLLQLLVIHIMSQNPFGEDDPKTTTQYPFKYPVLDTDVLEEYSFDGEDITIANLNFTHAEADLYCRAFGQSLAKIYTLKNAQELARDYLTVSKFGGENLWIGGKRMANGTWYWADGMRVRRPISEEIVRFINQSRPDYPIKDFNLCLAFGRTSHQNVTFQELSCNAQRAVLCDGIRSDPEIVDSTHKGWIRLDQRLYKIFKTPILHGKGNEACSDRDVDSKLAVISNAREFKEVGRHLRIGRPSLEMAHFDGKCNRSHCEFENEQIPLDLTPNQNRFPPWARGEVIRGLNVSCLALDWHVDEAFIVQVNCNRTLPFICYKIKPNRGNDRNHKDYFFGPYGYRIFYSPENWMEALYICQLFSEHYNGSFVSITSVDIRKHLKFIMQDNRTAVHHLWIGGQLNTSTNTWMWVSRNERIRTNDPELFNWLGNESYTEDVEQYNTCLNMDHEPTRYDMQYGAACIEKQPFVCSYPSIKLQELERDEVIGRKSYDSMRYLRGV